MKRILWCALLGGGLLTSPAWAGERFVLRNGFSIDCHHHEEMEDRVRLYTDRSQDSYIEVATVSIVTWGEIPRPAVEQPAPENVKTPAPSPAAEPAAQPLKSDELHELVAEAGRQHNLDVDLLASVIAAESGGRQSVVSRSGAHGLMQLMPGTARAMGVDHVGVPKENLRGGSAYLDTLLTRYHENLALALAAYNAGPSAVDRYHGIPPYRETQAYVARVIREFNRRVAARKAAQRHAVQDASAVTSQSLPGQRMKPEPQQSH